MEGERLKKLKKPIQGMAPKLEAEFNAAKEEKFPKRCAWEIEMEAMRRQIAVKTKQLKKNTPPTRTRTCCSTTKKRTCEAAATSSSFYG